MGLVFLSMAIVALVVAVLVGGLVYLSGEVADEQRD